MNPKRKGSGPAVHEAVEKVSWELLDTYEVLSTIHRSSDLLAGTREFRDAARITLDSAMEITASEGGMVLVPRGGTLQVAAETNAGHGVEDLARETRSAGESEAWYVDTSPDRVTSADGRPLRARLYVPFSMGERGTGRTFLFSLTDRVYSSIDVKRVQILCGQGSLALQCFLHMETLEERNLALRDALARLQAAQEELLRKERLSTLGRVAAMIVHDLKNPMGGLVGYAQLLETLAGELSPGEVRQYAGIITREMQRLARMTEEIVEFSRGMESKLNLRLLTPRDLVAAAVPVIESTFRNSGAIFSWEGVDGSVILAADSDKMERVFINLAVNALHAMDPPGRVEVSSFCEGSWVVFSFRDTGKGIPEEIRETLFDPFVSRKEGRTGLGIGLSVSRWVVEAHGGSIWVESTGPEGTEFRFRLPRSGPEGGREETEDSD